MGEPHAGLHYDLHVDLKHEVFFCFTPHESFPKDSRARQSEEEEEKNDMGLEAWRCGGFGTQRERASEALAALKSNLLFSIHLYKSQIPG